MLTGARLGGPKCPVCGPPLPPLLQTLPPVPLVWNMQRQKCSNFSTPRQNWNLRALDCGARAAVVVVVALEAVVVVVVVLRRICIYGICSMYTKYCMHILQSQPNS